MLFWLILDRQFTWNIILFRYKDLTLLLLLEVNSFHAPSLIQIDSPMKSNVICLPTYLLVWTGTKAHPASCKMGTGCLSLG